MNRQEQTEFNHLVKTNNSIREAIKKLIKPLNKVNQNILMDNIYNLIDNELEQETYANQ